MTAAPNICFQPASFSVTTTPKFPSPSICLTCSQKRKRRSRLSDPQIPSSSPSPSKYSRRKRTFITANELNSSIPIQQDNDQQQQQSQSQHDESNVIIMRHGTTNWNSAGRVQGNSDESRLNSLGIRQATIAGRRLKGLSFDSVLISPLSRARHTFNLIAKSSENSTLNSITPNLLDLLTEIQFPWQGLLRREISKSEWSTQYTCYKYQPRHFSYNGFNPVRDVEKRAQALWQQLKMQMPKSALVVSHNQTNKALVASALGLHVDLRMWNQANCCVNILTIPRNGQPVLRLFNYVSQETVSNAKDLNECQEHSLCYKRPLRRHGFTRLVVHHMSFEESENDANYKLLSKELNISYATRLYAVGGVHEVELANKLIEHKIIHSFRSLSSTSLLSRWKLTGQYENDEENIYEGVSKLLRKIRINHPNEAVGVITGDRRVVSAIFASSYFLGASGMSRVHSHPSSISIIDIMSGVKGQNADISRQSSRLECFSVPLLDGEDVLVPYTMPINPIEGST